jgi:hypothetical protein
LQADSIYSEFVKKANLRFKTGESNVLEKGHGTKPAWWYFSSIKIFTGGNSTGKTANGFGSQL